MTKKQLIFNAALVAMTVLATSSKNENKESIYLDELKSLCHEQLVNGENLSDTALEGKMVLVNFWASYDPTSRINSYDLVQMSDEFEHASFNGGDGLKVVCVSLDVFSTPLRKAIESDGTQGLTHICDLRGEESPLAKSFDVSRPVNLLMTADGRIVARDLGTDNIRATLDSLRME